MRTLMISLDKNVLHAGTSVAKRMIEYGENGALDIIVPSGEKMQTNLSEQVRVFGTGGNKWQQFWRVIMLGKSLKKNNTYDWITTQDPFMTSLTALLIRTNEKLEIQVHGDFFGAKYFRTNSFKNRLYYWFGCYTVRRADKVRVVGERVRQSVVALGVPAEKIVVRSVPINEAKIRVGVPTKNIKTEFSGFNHYFLYSGRLEQEKNVEWLVKVFDTYLKESEKNDVLIIVGDGSQKESLVDAVTRLNCSQQIIFKGWVADSIDYIKTADCVLIPSEAEGYGLVAMETAAAGTKLIMTDVGVANFELRPSDRITIVPVNNHTAFIQALKQI